MNNHFSPKAPKPLLWPQTPLGASLPLLRLPRRSFGRRAYFFCAHILNSPRPSQRLVDPVSLEKPPPVRQTARFAPETLIRPPPRLSEKSLLKFLTLQYLEGCREYCCGLQILDSRRVESVRQCHLARERGFRTIILPSRPPARPSSAYSSPSACCTQGSTGPSRPLS